MTADTIQAYATVAGLALAAVGLPLVLIQLAELQRSVRSAAHAAIYEHEVAFRSELVERPHLRRYFFDGADIDPDDAEFARVVTLAEMFLNYLEHMVVTIDSVGRGNRPSIERFVSSALAQSPILRRQLESRCVAHSHALLRFLKPPAH